MTERHRPIVMKFGGSSVADAEAIRRLTAIVRRRSEPSVIVVSALAGVTDRLIALAGLAATGLGAAASQELRDLEMRHRGVAALVKDPVRRAHLIKHVQQTMTELEEALGALSGASHLTPRACDRVAACGELLSSRIVAAALIDAGLPAVWVDARRLLVTDDSHSRALPLMRETRIRAEDELKPYLAHGYVPVVGGFVGATAGGETTTLGRGGSDCSAAILGACLDAQEIQIWTDVDGMLTADPRIVPMPRPVSHLSFAEAYELARFGAKVLHPATIAPAVEHDIPVRVLNSRHPDGAGTLITASTRQDATRVTALAGKRHLTLMDIESRVTLRPHQFLTLVAEAFERHATPITTMAVSDARASVAIEDDQALAGIVETLSSFADVQCQPDMALVCAVGGGARPDPAVFADVLATLQGVKVRMVSQPPSGRTIVLILQQSELPAVMTRLHDRFFGEEAPAAPVGYGHGV